MAYVADGKTEVEKGICGALPQDCLEPEVTQVWQTLFSTLP